MKLPIYLFLVSFGLASYAACGDDDGSRTADPAPAGSPLTTPQSPTRTEISDVVPDAPPRGGNCPLDADLCAMAGKIEAWVVARDAAAMLAVSRGKPYTCGPQSPRDICAGVPLGAIRPSFSMGEAALTATAFQVQVTRALNDLSIATMHDAWGPPGPHVGAIGCILAAADADRQCDDRELQVSVTLIGRFNGLGIDGRRSVYQVLLHREDGQLWVDGIGLSAPPLGQLYPFDIPASIDGTAKTLTSRPWLP